MSSRDGRGIHPGGAAALGRGIVFLLRARSKITCQKWRNSSSGCDKTTNLSFMWNLTARWFFSKAIPKRNVQRSLGEQSSVESFWNLSSLLEAGGDDESKSLMLYVQSQPPYLTFELGITDHMGLTPRLKSRCCASQYLMFL